MTPDSMANGVEEQKLLLKQYLGQYYYAKMKKKQLEARLRTFRENMLGTKGMQYSPVPRSQTNSVGDGPATQVIRAMEIEDRITESRDGKDHAECDEDHGFFTNGLHGTKHTGIQTH